MSKVIPVWSLKYKPNTLNEICGREKIKSQLKEFISKKNFPHLLLTGYEGVGKTTFAKQFAKEILGEFLGANFKILFADVPVSKEERDQAGISSTFSKSMIGSRAGMKRYIHPFLDIKVKPFVQIKVLGEVPFKILIVKNFETLGQFQHGFRRLMETYGSNCRFILITTKISSIIDPIISRCQIIFIPPIKFKKFKDLIKEISERENIEINEPSIDILYKYSKGQLNKAIDLLELASIKASNINSEVLFEVIKEFRDIRIVELLKFVLKNDFLKAREHLRKIRRELNYSAREIFKMLVEEINNLPLSTSLKIQFINYIADADFRSLDGQDDDIQLSNLISKLCFLSEKIK
jgi:replication factor C small subunit